MAAPSLPKQMPPDTRAAVMLESLPDPCFALDGDWRFTYLNHQAEQLWQRSRKDLLGTSIRDEFPEALGADAYDHCRRALTAQEAVTFESYDASRDRWMEVRAYPFQDGLAVSCRDVTASKQANARHAHLEERLELALQEAERATRARSEFLSRVSHELRTPLNAVLGFAQLLEMDVADPQQLESVQHIHRAGLHLLELINEVLDISRVEMNHLVLSSEPVPLTGSLHEALALLQPFLAQQRIQLHNAASTYRGKYLLADPQRLKQVLLNLLSNAVRYNHPGGTVTITCEEPREGWLRVNITDSGPGIPAENLERLFTPFDRLGAERTSVEGTGLGLALSRGLVEAMNGTLGVTSEVGVGSTFWVDLPLAERERSASDEPAEPLAGASPPALTVLYIEDNHSNLELVRLVLARRPAVRLLAAMEGQEGLALAQHASPDLILLDLHLPDLDGEEVLRHLKAEPATREIPVIILSADAIPQHIERLLKAGARDYLTKPLNIPRLLQTIDQTLHARSINIG
jgi:PAS domain S-box-containing protein